MNEIETMTGRVIVGPDGSAPRGTFPRAWGKPPDDFDERERWMRRNIREGEEQLNRGEKVEGQRVRTGRQALAALERRQREEAFRRHMAEADAHLPRLSGRQALRLLELNREGPQ